MPYLLSHVDEHVFFITLNRVDKHNAFDDCMLTELHQLLDEANAHPKAHVIVLKANGRHFSAGADLQWMQRMAKFSEAENMADAQILARLMKRLADSNKPTIAMVQGAAMGGGAGLVAACDFAIAAESAYFAFSEVKLGLIPAVISPYVIGAIGARAAKSLFMSGEPFSAQEAQTLGLVTHSVAEEKFAEFTHNFAKKIASLPPAAVKAAKSLVHHVVGKPIDDTLISWTAKQIAAIRVSEEGQRGLKTFLAKSSINSKPDHD